MKSVALKIVQKYHPKVKRVVDAKKPIVITVTPEDGTTDGVRDHTKCAFAQACERQEHADAAIVSVRSAYVVKGDKAVRYRVPETVSREVVAFDRSNGDGFAPGKYQLKVYSKRDRIGNYRPSGKHNGKKPTHTPKLRHFTGGIRSSLLAA